MVSAWGHPAAAIDVDQLYLNVDARWELPYDDARNAMVLDQSARLARSLFDNGWQTVMIFGNSLFDPADSARIVSELHPPAEIYHVTLTPDIETVLERCAGTARRREAVLRHDFDVHAARPHPASARLDNTDLTPEATLRALVRLVDEGAGRLV
ncbi:hypothetical protein ACFQX7_26365 [Luedemannella flava]